MAGLLGIGGGLIIVPVLLYILPHILGISEQQAMLIAVATSLSTVIFTGLSSARSHMKLGNMDKTIVPLIALGMAFGAMLGAIFATTISGHLLKQIFAALVILIALQMVFGRNRVSSMRLAKPALGAIGGGTGFVSALMGIGGGALLVPALVFFKVNIRKAIGVAAITGVVIASFGTAGYIYSGWSASLPKYALGYVYLPASLGIVLTSMLTAPIGAKLTARIDTVKLRRIFAVFLVLVSVRMIIGIE